MSSSVACSSSFSVQDNTVHSKDAGGATTNASTISQSNSHISLHQHNPAASHLMCITGSVLVLATSGLVCSLYATGSCQWYDYEWNGFDNATIHSTLWSDIPDRVGLFRYQPMDSPGTCESYRGTSIFVSRQDDPWVLTAQLCLLFSAVIASLSILSFCMDRRFLAACGWLLATGLQTATTLASTSMCSTSNFWACPWLQGAHANTGAAICFLFCWVLTLLGSIRQAATFMEGTVMEGGTVSHPSDLVEGEGISTSHEHHHHYYHREGEDNLPVDNSEEGDASSTEQKYQDELDIVEAGRKVTAEELLGTSDPIIHRAIGMQADVIREFMNRTTTRSQTCD
eukprot:Nitzschia sp. Nitz4//scaffold373_size14178//2050//3151//NITZ4_008952-RA/size14178-augustus-gene-0.29-mRNA-1//-1//CDS//3329549601//6049//frame0